MKDANNPHFDFDCALVTDIGMKRKQNQDSGLVRPDLSLFIVADGMGGHQGGETASRVCVETVVEVLSHNNSADPVATEHALQAANRAVFDLSEKETYLKGMGTTCTILHISNDLATLLQVGDSRAYYFNEAGIWQLTRDHSLVQEKLRAGLITREQMKVDEMKNVITRSVGYEPVVRGDVFQFHAQKGDGFLLCSDGLSGPLDDSVIFEILEESMASGLSLEDTARKLVAGANGRGGDDNVTVVLVKLN